MGTSLGKKTMNLFLTEEQRKRLQKAGEILGISQAEVISLGLELILKEWKTADCLRKKAKLRRTAVAK